MATSPDDIIETQVDFVLTRHIQALIIDDYGSKPSATLDVHARCKAISTSCKKPIGAPFMIEKSCLKPLIFLGFLFSSGISAAYEFRPTDGEWHAWPGRCKAIYISTNIGMQSKYVNMVNPEDKAELAEWEAAGIRGLHHFCAGTLWIQRARLQTSPERRSFELEQAMAETQFTVQRSDPRSYRFPELVIQVATILYEAGELDAALEVLQDGIRDHPQSEVLYSAAAIIHWKRGSLAQAKATLLQGHEALGEDSAEINYNLGLVSLELGELDEAERYAQLAYELGYPLPGLRAKLQRLGRMQD